MKTTQFKNENFVNSQKELNEKIEECFEMLLSIENDSRGKYVACFEDDYKDVFKEVTGREFNDDCDIAFPITETLGQETLFETQKPIL